MAKIFNKHICIEIKPAFFLSEYRLFIRLVSVNVILDTINRMVFERWCLAGNLVIDHSIEFHSFDAI